MHAGTTRGDALVTGQTAVNRHRVGSLVILAALVFLVGEKAAFASPLSAVPGRHASATFLERCIMETSVPLTLSQDSACPPHFSCGPDLTSGEVSPIVPPMRAGMVSFTGHDTEPVHGAPGPRATTMPLLILGIVLISFSNIIRLAAKRQQRRIPVRSRADKAVAAGH